MTKINPADDDKHEIINEKCNMFIMKNVAISIWFLCFWV